MRCATLIAAIVAAAALSGCMSTQAGFTPLSAAPAKAADAPVDVFEGDNLPDRAYTEVAVLDVHFEATHLITHSFADALPQLKKQAREAGGDAIIEIKETKSRYLETSMYHVTAKAVRYTD